MIHVVAAAVIDPDGRVLIAQRPQGKHLAGGWEFPGGKLEAGEARREGLARELREELGIEIRTPRPLIRLKHTYPYGDVLLDVWVVSRYAGTPRGMDGQALRWLTQDELERAELLPADGPVVRALRLPERLMVALTRSYSVVEYSLLGGRLAADREAPGQSKLVGAFCADGAEAHEAAEAGAEFLVLRNSLADGAVSALCGSIPIPVFVRGLSLEQAWERGASGCSEIVWECG